LPPMLSGGHSRTLAQATVEERPPGYGSAVAGSSAISVRSVSAPPLPPLRE
jgi:hypothetical protein